MKLLGSSRKGKEHASNAPLRSQTLNYAAGPATVPAWHIQDTPYYLPPQPPSVVVNQHYYINAPSSSPGIASPRKLLAGSTGCIAKLNLGSVANLATDLLPMDMPHIFDDRPSAIQAPGPTFVHKGMTLYDQLSSGFDSVLTSIDHGLDTGREGYPLHGLVPYPQTSPYLQNEATPVYDGGGDGPTLKIQPAATSLPSISANYFAKVDMYANSKLNSKLPPLRLYVNTYPLLCLAAKYSDCVYEQPRGAERYFHVNADWRTGTKAMVIRSVPMDHTKTIVFAIRGTATFMDWAVNMNVAPTSPAGFLDDPGNLCHAGFLSVARNMIQPVAKRLRELLQEGRTSYSLLITGHSAGGAVAALLYSHMLAISQQASSELNSLAGRFRRIHCITFGTPPVSLLPLANPDRKGLNKYLFLSIINEGDPVARADKAYVKSLLELFVSPISKTTPNDQGNSGVGIKDLRTETAASPLRPCRPFKLNKHHQYAKCNDAHHTNQLVYDIRRSRGLKPVWKVPQSTLSNPGRLIVLRAGCPAQTIGQGHRSIEELLDDGVVAQLTTDEQLREVIWGDPTYHTMKLYAGRIETLAIGAVTANGCDSL
ncbi:lipase, class 3 [Grosmannia clavigera kw1407]|uniref:Lipase, class 3 n=1 Tax=Grosmannia clavigera (strain kw1407 / UAMH 11150) TaxID=655863 RepID=F0XP08_GROCL|nr:lipase, class 3 [Grosmannia clavigera kw1407]EFX00458.1 lipase, class 3 [Grosmannia clavigera kw1407]